MTNNQLIQLIIEHLEEEIETMKDQEVEFSYQDAIDSLILDICENLDDLLS